jgi:hypothetical protein
MNELAIMIDNPEVEKLSAQAKIPPTFEIINLSDKSYPCDPTAAVDSAHIVFEGFTYSRQLGSVTIDVSDSVNACSGIVDWLHGRPLFINATNAKTLSEMGKILGIHLIEEYAAGFEKSNNYRLCFEDDSDE